MDPAPPSSDTNPSSGALRSQYSPAVYQKNASPEVYSTDAKIIMTVAVFFTLILLDITLTMYFGIKNPTAMQSLIAKSLAVITGVIGGCTLISGLALTKYYIDNKQSVPRTVSIENSDEDPNVIDVNKID